MFFFPLYDDNPTRRFPVVTVAIMALCVLVYAWQFMLEPRAEIVAVYSYGLVPASLFGHVDLPAEAAVVPPWTTVFTSMFLHGGILHLGGNLLYLWIFGNNVEDSMGRGRFVLFYLGCGVAAALAQSLSAPHSEVPMIGASGAIGGVLGAYFLLHPRANVRALLWIVVFVTLVNVPAVLVLGLWFLAQIFSGVLTPTTEEGGVAFWAHAGGFLAGMALIPFFRRRGVGLWQPPHSRAFSTMPAKGAMRRRGSVPESGDRDQSWR